MSAKYVPPRVTDHGNLVDLTAATDFAGPEDGGNKLHVPVISPHHS